MGFIWFEIIRVYYLFNSLNLIAIKQINLELIFFFDIDLKKSQS